MNKGYTWYGHPLSYFSMKLDAALGFYGVHFDRTEITLATTLEPIRQRAGTHMIPVLETPEGWALWDTTPILFMLDGRIPDRQMFGPDENGLLVHVIENFLDEWLGRTMVHYRWHYPESADFAAPQLASGDAEVAKSIAAWGLKACRATGVDTSRQQEMCEAEYERILTAAEAQLGQSRYLLGDAPCALDAVILGGLRAHTLRDPVPARLLARFPRVVEWAEAGANNWDGTGVLAPPRTPTDFANAMLAEMTQAFIPFIIGNRAALAVDEKAFTARVFDEEVSFLTRPYPEKACEMVNDHIARLPDTGAALIKRLGLQKIYRV